MMKNITYVKAINSAIEIAMNIDDKVFVMVLEQRS